MQLANGSLGETTFVKSKDGYRAQVKREMDKTKFKTDPAFQRVRENNSEFGTATQVGKLLRYSINPLIPTGNDGRLVSRLIKAVMKVIKSDTVSPSGKRNFLDGNLKFVREFEINDSTVKRAFKYIIPAVINRVSGELSVVMPAFSPKAAIVAPAGVTHFELVSAGTELDVEGITYKTDTKSSGILPIDSTPLVVNQVNHVTGNSTHPLMIVFGVKFHEQESNGTIRPFHEGKEDALQIVVIDKP